MKTWHSHTFALGIVGATALVTTTFVLTAPDTSVSFVRDQATTTWEIIPQKPKVTHVATPVPVKGIYMTQCVVGTPSFRDSLVTFVDDTELNSIVIDIKDFSGGIAFPTQHPLLKDFVSKKCGAYDMKDFIERLHEKGIYVIGRITVFQDPLAAAAYPDRAVQKKGGGVWHDHKGLAFIDVGAKAHWDYIVELSKVSYEEFGFDELNYDYIRFPSDGPMDLATYSHSIALGKSKQAALEEFFKYLHEHVAPLGVKMSADLFGYTTVHVDDLGIGQIHERALPHFDYIMPMVYPSHYNSGFAGLKNVNSDPYKIVYASMIEAVRRTEATVTPNYAFGWEKVASTSPYYSSSTTRYIKPAYSKYKMRPWLQSFDYPVPYTPEMVRAQIKANEDSGLDSYIFWDASNKYSSLRKVLAAPPVVENTPN